MYPSERPSYIAVGGVFGAALFFYMAQAVLITATAWAENPPSETARNLEVTPELAPLSEISPYFIDALIAADDPNFYNRTPEQTARVYEFFKSLEDAMNSKLSQNPNMGEEGYVRARKALLDAAKLNWPENTDLSFISRFLSSCDGLGPGAFHVRKLAETASVLSTEWALSKNSILLLYINRIYLGRRLFGVSAASQAYFGKRAKDLTLAEAAFLVGLSQAPSKFSRNTEIGLKCRNEVLDAMVESGKITLAQAAAAKAEPLDLNPARTSP
jgi:membrane peptidoglycan carboxypeptidase